MNEKTLLPCPFCAGVNFSEHYEDRYGHIVRCTRCGGMIASHMGMKDTKHNWNTRTTPPQQPLTLEELLEMKGEPVWIDYATAFGSRYEKWAVQAKHEGREDVISFTDDTALISSKYGCKWFAYRQKPTEG